MRLARDVGYGEILLADSFRGVDENECDVCALSGLEIEGVASNIGFLLRVIGHPAFRAGDAFTGFIGRHAGDLVGASAV